MARLAPLTAVLLLAALALADMALAQAGSGSGSFGGGGSSGGGGFSGGGGGSSFGGGSSGSGSGSASPIGLIIFFGIFGLVVAWVLFQSALYHRKVQRRRARVRTAAGEAAEDDAYLAADAVERDGARLYVDAQAAWDARDRERLAQLVGGDLLVEWNRRLDDFDRKGWHNRVNVRGEPEVEYVGLVNREDDSEDRVVVRIGATMDAYVQDQYGNRIMRDGEKDATIHLTEYWTLARRGDGWMVVSIEQKAEGDHHLDADIVATPWEDERMSDQALTELAAEDKVPDGFTTADLATLEFDGDARAHALDLSLADARFAPDVLEAAARRAVAAWAEAVDGEDEALEAVASPEAVGELLYGGDAARRTRLVVRGPRVKKIKIRSVDVERQPATMAIQVDVFGRRYVEDRDTTDVLRGDKNRPALFVEQWTLALDGPDTAPWRVVDTSAARV